MTTDHGEKYCFALALIGLIGVASFGYLGLPLMVDVFKDVSIGATACLYGLIRGSKGGA